MPWLAEPQYLLTRERQGQCRPLWNMREVWEMKGQGDSGVCSPIAGRGRVTLSPQALPVWVGMGWEGSNSFFGAFLLLVDLVLGILPGFTLSLCSFLMSNRKVTGQEPVSLPSS